MTKILQILFSGSILILLVGCQDQPFEKSPIHLNPNMDDQERYEPQEVSYFFEDARTMRQPVPGTIARGDLRDDSAIYFGKDDSGSEINYIPFPITHEFISRGQERYDIFCAPCHSRVGDGKGIIMKYEYPIPPPSFHEDRIRSMTDGYFFTVISDGVRNMPSYKHQIAVKDRWAIVSYVRALQRSQDARSHDVPTEILNKLK